ncbi:hypothetical protein [Sutcliffiella halmapala]|uniref:hypothetical protein n=1 Tax=Sutcliffiella halmapala TaxID=79882 RepID=UPI0009956810|nr:hypothetical protein [Sutcliffiella halmapala]
MNKRFFLLLLLFFLLIFQGDINKIYANQVRNIGEHKKDLEDNQVVTAMVHSDIWYENIFLLAKKFNSMAHKNFTIQVGLSGSSSVLQYNFPEWYNDKFSPDLFYEDLNKDELKDIIVVLISGSGTGLSTKDIHILHQKVDPYQRFEEVSVDPISSVVKRLVKFEKEGEMAIITIGKKTYKVDVSKFDYNPKTYFPKPFTGGVEEYRIEKGILYGTTVVYISPSGSIGELEIEYLWDGTKYSPNKIEFRPQRPSPSE